MTKITFDFDQLKTAFNNTHLRVEETGWIYLRKEIWHPNDIGPSTTYEPLIQGTTDTVGFLFLWYPQIFKDYDWLSRVIRDYFNYSKKTRNFIHFVKDFTEPIGLVWSNHSRYELLDYHEYFLKFKSIVYIQKNPIDAMESIYFWLNKEYDEDYAKLFIKYHLPRYIASIKWDGKYAHGIVDYDALKGNPLVLKNILSYVDCEINEEAFEKAFKPPKKLSYIPFSQENKDLISEIWKKEGMI